jgi:hypothetical protein
MSDYITVTEFKATAELIGFSFADNDIAPAISAASRGIDEYCGRRFYPDADTTAVRYYSPTRPRTLNIDDLIALGTVQADIDADGTFETTWILNRDYLLEPLNAAADAKPYEWIRVHPASNQRFPVWPRSIKVTGQFGWTAVPPTVKEATTIMATRLLRRARDAPFGVVGLGIDQTAIRIGRTDPDVGFLLDNFVKGQGILIA